LIVFKDPLWLLLLLIVPIGYLIGRLRGRERKVSVRFPTVQLLTQSGGGIGARLQYAVAAMRWLAIVLLALGLARPQKLSQEKQLDTQGIDIILALDISTSMLAEDFNPNRLVAAKQVASDFISERNSDQIGLVVFAGQSFTQCPLTLDYNLLTDLLTRVNIEIVTGGMLEDGTAIGMAIANGVNRLRASEAKSRIIILLTDGQNNRGEIDPATAASAAKALGIRIYTIGVGTEGMAPYPVRDRWGRTTTQQVQVEIDEALLKQIAHDTGGEYFRAKDEAALRDVYRELDKLEKSKIRVHQYRQQAELFPGFLWAAAALLLLEIILTATRLRRLP